MNKNDKDFMNQFNNLNDVSVEDIAEKYPGLCKKTKKRILKQCMKKTFFLLNIPFCCNLLISFG